MIFTIIGFLIGVLFGIWLIGMSYYCFHPVGEPDKKAGLVLGIIALIYWYFLISYAPFSIVVT